MSERKVLYSGPVNGLLGEDSDYEAVNKLSERFSITEELGYEIVALLVEARGLARLAAIDRIKNFAAGAASAGHAERAQAARDIINMLRVVDRVFDDAITAPSDTPSEADVKRVARAIGEVMLPEVTMISAAMSLRVKLKISLGDSRASGVLEDIARSALRAIAVASDHITDDTPSSGGER